MTTYAVTVRAYGDHIVEAESSEQACEYVQGLGVMMSNPDSDWYIVEIDDVREESETVAHERPF